MVVGEAVERSPYHCSTLSTLFATCMQTNIGRLSVRDLFHLTKILRPATPKWKEIGGALKFQNDDLEIIETRPTLIVVGVTGYFREMLNTWLKWAPPTHSWPTIQTLIHAVRSSGEENLAVELQNYNIIPE